LIWDFLKVQKRSSVTSLEADNKLSMPENFKLYQNYPNPFNPSTRIRYQLATSGHVTLTIFNLAGQGIATLVDEFQSAGMKPVTWDGLDEQGR